MSISAIFWKSCQNTENWKTFLMSNSCFRGQRHCQSVATRKKHPKTDQVCLYLPSTKDGIIFSQVLAMEHLQYYSYTYIKNQKSDVLNDKFAKKQQK